MSLLTEYLIKENERLTEEKEQLLRRLGQAEARVQIVKEELEQVQQIKKYISNLTFSN